MLLIVTICGILNVLALMVYDVRTYRLPNRLTALHAILGLAYTYLAVPHMIVDHMLAGFLGFASFFLISLFYRHFRKMDGMGMGDAKLFAGIGLWSGVFYLAPVALLGSLSALVVVLVLHGVGKPVGRGSKIPFGFFLGFGFLVVFYATRFSVVAY